MTVHMLDASSTRGHRIGDSLPASSAGFAYLVDENNNFILDENNNYIEVEI